MAGKTPGIILAGCWAHARRGFADLYKMNKDLQAAIAVKKIAGLYRLEKKISSRPVEKIRQWRQRYARPILEDLWSWRGRSKDALREVHYTKRSSMRWRGVWN